MLKPFITAALVIAVVFTVVIGAAQLIGGVLDEYILAYMAQTANFADLHLMAVERTMSINLTRTPALHESYPAWSPDGHYLLFNQMDIIGQGVCVIAPFEDATPRCLDVPDRRIEHQGWKADSQTVFIWRHDQNQSASANIVTEGDLLTEMPLAWLSYSRDRRYRIGFSAEVEQTLRIYDAQTDRAWTVIESVYFSTRPALSPDGSWIAFSAIMGADPDLELYVIDTAEGSTPVQLTFNTRRVDESPTWSPDGAWIAFVSDRDDPVRSNTYLYVMRANGNDVRRLTFDAALYREPAWKP